MPSKKQQREKDVLEITLPLLGVTTVDRAEYMRKRRQLEKQAADPEFIKGLTKQYNGFLDFLRNYDINPVDIKRFLDMDMSEFLKPQRQRR